MLIMTNVCQILYDMADHHIFKWDKKCGGTPEKSECIEFEYIFYWGWIQAIAYFFNNFLFSLSYWLFAFEYYKIAQFMPLALQEKPVSTMQIKNTRTLNIISTSLNATFSLLSSISVISYNILLFNKAS